MQLFLVVLLAVVAAAVGTLLNFRFLLYPFAPSLNPLHRAQRLELKGNTLFISDLHLRASGIFDSAKHLREFTQGRNVSNLVIVGDLFNSLKDARMILAQPGSVDQVLNILGLDGLPLNTFWVLGSPKHDPQNAESYGSASRRIRMLGDCAQLRCGGRVIVAYHGHHLSHIGAVGHGWNRFLGQLGLEKGWRKLALVDDAAWTIFGHTHIPGLSHEERIANCGGWSYGPFVRPSKTVVLFSEEDDLLRLVRIG